MSLCQIVSSKLCPRIKLATQNFSAFRKCDLYTVPCLHQKVDKETPQQAENFFGYQPVTDEEKFEKGRLP